MTLEVREVRFTDIERIYELLQDVSEFKPSEVCYKDIWESFVQQAHVISLVLICKEGDEILGYGSVCLQQKIRGGVSAYIEDVVVDCSSRNSGLGRFLVNELVKKANEKGCYKVSLESREHNVPFYKKINFVTTGIAMSILNNK